jgi:single-strand DNA-binding protein
MNSFTLTAVGHLARNPELVAKGNTAYTRFCLVGTDYAGKDEEGAAREVVTSLWFVAFGALGEAVARHSRKGDQLVVEARVRANHWTDKQGEKQYDHSFVVQGFRFGAPGRVKREERDTRREDGHGLRRSEERAYGRDRSTNSVAHAESGTRTSLGTHTGLGSYTGFGIDGQSGPRTGVVSHMGAVARAGRGDGAISGAVGGTNAPAEVTSAISARVPVRGNDGSGVKGSGDVGGAPDGDEADGAGEPADTHGSIGGGESDGTGESIGANESGGAGESVGADASGGTGESVGADASGGTGESVGTDESGGSGESVDADELGGTGESVGADESGGTGEPIGADESVGTGKTTVDGAVGTKDSIGRDKSREPDEAVRGDVGARDAESARGSKNSNADRGADDRVSAAGGVAKDRAKAGAKISAKGGASRVAEAGATAGRTREKSSVGRTGRRTSSSAA